LAQEVLSELRTEKYININFNEVERTEKHPNNASSIGKSLN
jgi:hypothetical protein